ncbi:MAG: hypothetical protein OEV95_11735, partial [Gemmatimonadota bacterium]|nr:hypothetical protein [Gemmatimonadota bacterium]
MFLVAAPANADLSDVWEGWKPRIELIGILLPDSPSQIVRRHSASFTAAGSGLSFTTEDGSVISFSLEGGWLRRDGKTIARYPEGGALEAAWRDLVREVARASTPDALDLIREWQPDGLSSQETAMAKLLRDAAAELTAPAGGGVPH